MNNSAVETILKAAIRAPSGDNLQPWKIVPNENKIDFIPVSTRDGSLYNTGDRGTFFSLGALVENAIIAAEHVGFVTELVYRGAHGASLYFKENPAGQHRDAKIQNGATYEAIFKRCTNRFPYEKELLTSEQKQAMRGVFKAIHIHDIALRFLDAPQLELTQCLSVNERLVFENRRLHHDFFSTLSWSGTDLDKMPVYSLGLPLIGLCMFKLARSWPRLDVLNKIGFSKMIPKQTALLYQACGGYGALLAHHTDTTSYFNAGRGMQRIWLEATIQQLAIQPLNGIILLRHAIKQNTELPLSENQKSLIIEKYNAIKNMLATEQEILFMFRIGKPTTGTLITPRMDLSNVLE
ncbi:MAG TPA: hypothetical protein VMU13_03215 [Candidatus Paceibacterota bacterium]|nr:hypothetical protein [Candidatus Paceibacterota bacterium]